MQREDLHSTDKKHLWHPFTQMKEWMEEENVIIERAEGIYLYDTEGNRYIDGVSSLWCNVHGHRRKEIDNAIRAQLEKVAHSTMLGLSNVPAIELAARLVRIAPAGLKRVFYSDSGSEAVEIALKMAFQFWQHRGGEFKSKTKFLTLTDSYHGDTIGAVSLGGIEMFRLGFKPLLFETVKAPAPYCYRCPFQKRRSSCRLDCLRTTEQLVKTHHHELAAVFLEPLVLGAAGIITQPPGYLAVLRDICTRYNVLLIFDEVATGFGRTGRMFASEHEGVSPDIMAIAKGLSGGYLPLAATLTTETVFEEFLGSPLDRRTFFHGHTFTGNPLACAAAIASLDIFEKDQTLEKLQPKIEVFSAELTKISELPHVGHVRQAGFMAGIELVLDKKTTERYDPGNRIGHNVCRMARRLGAFLRPLGDVIVVMPPLVITERELLVLMDIVRTAIEKTTR